MIFRVILLMGIFCSCLVIHQLIIRFWHGTKKHWIFIIYWCLEVHLSWRISYVVIYDWMDFPFHCTCRHSVFTFACSVFSYRPQRSWGKVISSQASVILLTGGVLPPGGCFLHGGTSSQGCVLPPGGAGGDNHPPPGTATAAGGTHPTGMHSCCQ